MDVKNILKYYNGLIYLPMLRTNEYIYMLQTITNVTSYFKVYNECQIKTNADRMHMFYNLCGINEFPGNYVNCFSSAFPDISVATATLKGFHTWSVRTPL